MNKEEKIAFLRGFFEGDGCLSFSSYDKGKYRYYTTMLTNTDPFLIKTIKKMLLDLGLKEVDDFLIYMNPSKKSYDIVFSKTGREKFLELIRRPLIESVKGQKIEHYFDNRHKTGKELSELYVKQWKPRENKEYRIIGF